MNRRDFLWSSAVPVAAMAMAPLLHSVEQPAAERVLFSGDGLFLTPAEYSQVLAKIVAAPDFKGDMYLHEGPVAELEQRFATILKKEKALFLPTGTLANHLAVRLLAGEHRKVVVQQESHLYRDEGDCAQLLSGLNLVALAPGQATISVEELQKAVEQAEGPPYPAPVGAIAIENPVRRTQGTVFDFDTMKKISAYTRSKKIPMRMDGARVFLASAYTGIPVADYAALFDTVYVSLYKYFNAPFGAILAGPKDLMDRVEVLRHQFGSLIFQGWPAAAVALHYVEGFEERFRQAMRNGETLLKLLESDGRFKIERIKNGTNIFGFHLASGAALDQMRERLAKSEIFLNGNKGGTTTRIQINESINRRSPEELADAFAKAV